MEWPRTPMRGQPCVLAVAVSLLSWWALWALWQLHQTATPALTDDDADNDSSMYSALSCGLLGTAAMASPAPARLNMTFYHGATEATLFPHPLPAPHASVDGDEVIRLFQTLGRTTAWKSIANVSFEGDTFEPEGLVRLGDDRYVVSAGEYTEATAKFAGGRIVNGTDRSAGAGFAHLLVFDSQGRRLADATLTAAGDPEYHNGGIDYDGSAIWGTIAQYRPNSTAYAYRVSPANLAAAAAAAVVRVIAVNDHLGGVVHDTVARSISVLNWGARNATTFRLGSDACPSAAAAVATVRNPSYFVDYQDCKWLGRSAFYASKSIMLCSGVATIGSFNLGGIALVDVDSMVPLAEVPIPLVSALGVSLTQNPVDVSIVDGKLRFYWIPDQHNSTLYVYEAQPDSPFEFGGGQQ